VCDCAFAAAQIARTSTSALTQQLQSVWDHRS
jgi:hypothetical protein